MIKHFLLVGLGGAIGSMLRYAGGLLYTNKSFPLTTFLINITGSFVIGMVIGVFVKNESSSHNWKLFLATGICGGFTTFSTFSFENLQLLQEGKIVLSSLYILGSIVIGITASLIGFKLIN
jgi:fluoride exporter